MSYILSGVICDLSTQIASFLVILKNSSLFGSDNSEPKTNFFDGHFFWVQNLKVGSLFVSDNSDPQIIFRFFCHFLCNLKVGSLFVSDNSDPKIIFRTFFVIFCVI